jgi:DnaD/phage-associated family protein
MATKLLLDDEPLVILPSLAASVGLNESIILQQLHYWLERSNHVYEGHKWVYNTYEEWQEQFPFWSVSTIRRIISKLEEKGLIIVGNFNKSKIDKTKWYRIDYEKMNALSEPKAETVQSDNSTAQNEQTTDEIDSPSAQNEQSMCSTWSDDLLNLNRPIPENTTENTSEIKKEEVEEDARVRDLDLREVVNFFEQNGFGTVGSHIGERIASWIDDTSKEIVIEAMKTAVENGAPRWVYVETILRDWYQKGCRTVEQARAVQLAFKEQQAKKRNGSGSAKQRQPVRTEMLPDWLNIDYGHIPDSPSNDDDVEKRRRELEERLRKYSNTPSE